MSARPPDRRAVLAVGALGLISFAVVRQLWRGRDPEFEPINGLSGFRKRRSTGAITSSRDPFIGLDSGNTPAGLIQARADVKAALCDALFRGYSGRLVPIAYFFDYQCPICRRLTPKLRNLDGAQIIWHDLATLGATSQVAAQASISAGYQGAYEVFHDRLMRARFLTDKDYVRTLADSVGIDGARLLADMNRPEVATRMWRSRALADMFGMFGTPGLVVGRSLVIGDIGSADLARLVDLEARDPQSCIAR